MAFSSFRNSPTGPGDGTRKALIRTSMAALAGSLLVPLLISSQAVPQPAARLEPARLTVSLAPDAAPVDLTTTLSNGGNAALTWRIGAIRDVSAETAPAVASGPVSAAKLYAKANIANEYSAGEIIVGLKGASEAGASALATPPSTFLGGRCKVKKELAVRARRAKGAKPGQALKLRAGRKLLLVTVEDKSKAGLQKAIDDLRKDPNVAYAEPNFRVKAVGIPSDPDFPLLYGLHNEGQTGGVADADIDAPEAWDIHTGTGEVVVGIIDTGIDYLHPDLVDNVWTNPGEIPANGVDDDGNGYIDDVHGYDFVNDDPDPMDDHFHGTHVAGTIAGRGDNGAGVTGVAWKAKVAGLKFLDAGGFGNLDDAIEAVAYANAMNIPITNNSWGGGGFSQALKDVIDAAGQRGFLFMAAAGNAGNDNDAFPEYPASYESDNIIAVAATDSRDEMAFFSSFGATTVDLGAPGVDIWSCAPNAGYQYLSGTSMATPHVAGAAALLKSYNPQLSGAEIKAALLSSTDPVPALSGRTLTGGRLNLAKALEGVNPPWLSVAPKGPGSIAAGGSQVLVATVDPRALTAGEHRALVSIPTNDPNKPDQELEVVATVSGCKNLAVNPADLDFGSVWRSTSRRMAVILRNTCNDFTTVSAVESPSGEFAAAGILPLRVPPFGSAALEVAYNPSDLGADEAVLTVRSDAADHPALQLAVRGTGVEPPAVAVSPSDVEVTLDPAERAVRALTVRNTGGDDLVVDLRTSRPAAKAAKAGPSPRLVSGKGKGSAWSAPLAPAGKLPALKPAFHASAAGLKVLYVTTLIGPGFDDQFTTGLRGLANVGSLEVLFGGNSVPNADYLKAYDAVIVAANQPWADATALGDALADYVDQGGTVALLTAAIAGGGGYSLRGRIATPDYMPIEMAGPGFGGEAVDFEDHAVTKGVKMISCSIPTAATQTLGKGEPLGRYPNGSLVGAVNPDKPVVALNVFPSDFAWGGDFILMMGNTLDYLSGAASWLKVQPRHAVIPAGGSADFTLEISAEGQLAGDHPSGVEIEHNAPSGANPLVVPVMMRVRPVSRLALAPAKHDFGSILLGNSASATVTLVNSGNQATTVSGIAAEGDFSSAVPAPITVPAFGEAVIGIRYVPSAEGNDVGGLTFASDAADHPSLRIALRGNCLPAPLAALAPERLAVSLAYNAPPRDLTSTLSNGGRGILHYQVTQVKDVTPSKPAAKALAVQAERIYQASNYDLPAVPGELLVGFKEGTQGLANAAALGNGVAVKRFLGRAKAPKNRASTAAAWKMPRRIAVVSVADGSKAGVQKAIAALRNDANVAYAEPNYIWKAVATPNDPDYSKLWGMHNIGQTGGVSDADIDAPEAWDAHTGDENGVVGVIDTGIDWLHPDLAANVWTNAGEIAGNGIDDDANGFVDDVHGYDFVNEDGDPMDDHYHGTHCAGTIAGVGGNGQGVAGVSWKARVAGLKFLDAGGSGSTDDAVEAVAYANAMDIPITSNSWGGGGFSQALKDVIDAAGARGFLFIAAAGNSSSDNDQFPNFPSNYESENIIAVAATDHQDALAYFSCFGATTVDLGAPGVDIYSLAPGNQYQYLSGTSMATPHVSGAAALIRSYNPTLTGSEIKAALLASVDPIPALDGKTVTGGRLNIAKAIGGVSPPWLVVNPRAAGTLQPGASQVLTATVDPAGLIAGEHRGIATIATDDPAHPTLQLEVVATVSGCKSLTVTPAALDHGSVWLGKSRRLSLLLTNKCNDVTTLSAVESSHKAFQAVTALPLAVAPFGTAVIEVEYVPDDLKADKATLTLKSDAQDNPVLKVQDKGTGVKPPSILVEPAKLSLTLDPSEQKRSALKVTNKGGADLLVSLKAKAERPAKSAPAPKLAAAERKAGKRYARAAGKALKPAHIHPLVRTSAAGLKLLYLTTLWQPQDGDIFSQAVRGLPQVASLDVVDGGSFVPNADYLKAYDQVLVSADFPWADPVATGDALADYVDDGGRVVLMVAATAAGGGYEIQGRIGGPDYMPIEKAGPGFGGIATSFADHPITAGLESVECALPTAALAVQGGATALGQYDNGALLGAVHAEKAVVALNVFPSDFAWSGHFILMVSNTLDFLDGFANWVKPEVATLTVPAGKTVETGLLFDTEGLDAGAYAATVSLSHNSPAGVNPVLVPVALTVKAKACLEAAPMAVDFGKVWSGRSAVASVELSNPCNRPTTVRTLTASPKVFKAAATVPLVLAPFSKATVGLTYTPDGIKTDKGDLVVKSDAQDHPQLKVALSGAGVKPPSISVKPTALAVTLDPGITADKTVDITNAGGDTLRVKVSAEAVEEGATRPKGKLVAGKPASVRPLVGEVRPPLAISMPRRTAARAAALRVLYVNTLWHPDSSSAEDQFTQALRQLPSVASVDLLDATWQTPDAAYLLGYDAVIVAADMAFSDAWSLGNALADYVDAGGKLLLMANAFYDIAPWGLDGRIVDSSYMPIGRSWTNWDGNSPTLADHPINEGVSTFSSLIHIATSGTQGNGVALGSYSNGYLTGAANPDKPIAALNVFPADGYWGGDVMIMVDNALRWMGGSIKWMKPAERTFIVAPGRTKRLTLTFDTQGMMASINKGLLAFEHNAPAGANPLQVPVTLKVNAKRCLAVEPKSVDFGDVWKGGTAESGYTLVNKCNEPVQVDKVKSSDAAFATAIPLPLIVPAFGAAGFTVTFSPKDTRAHKTHLEFAGNAQDNPKLNLALAGRGIRPPEIAVTPGSFRESAKAGESLTRVLTVKNAGGDALQVRFSTEDGAGNGSVPPVCNPRKKKGFAKASVTPWTSRGAALTSFRRASAPAVKAAGLRVLYFNTVVPEGYTDNFVEGLRSLPEVASVDLMDGSYWTPDADYLAAYDAVIVASSWSFADPDAAGNALADYVDRGGKVAILTAAISNWQGLAIGGRFATSDYMPLTMEGPGKGGPVVAFENHPINEGITFLESWYPTATLSVQGEGQPLGTLMGGSLLGAYFPRKAVVALNVFPMDFAWSGDLIPMMGNILEYLDGFGAWLKAEPRNLTVPAGGSAKANVILDASKTTGGVHDARLILAHNVPGKPSVTLPVNLTVAGMKALALSTGSLQFGDVLLGNAQSLDLVLSNSGNLPLTVQATRTGSGDFSYSGAAFPLVLEAGERVRLSVAYSPSVHGDAAASLAFEAAGATAVRASLSGRGLRPADFRASTNPAPLRFTVVSGSTVSGSLRLANAGDEKLLYMAEVRAAADAASVKAAAAAYAPSHHVKLQKGALDTRVGQPVDLASGGPDAYGHRWFDSDMAGGPAFAWTDISATGRLLSTVSSCDDCSEDVELSFGFPFYRSSGYPSVSVSSNGYVTFAGGSSEFSNHPIPSASMPGNLVAALFQDLYPAGGGSIFFQDYGDRAVIQYTDVPDFQGTGRYDFQIVLSADGTVDLLYKSLTGVKNTATVGIQNGDATDGLGVAYNADYLHDGLAVRIRTWVAVPSRFGALGGLESKTLPVSLDSRGLAPGTYTGSLYLTSGASRALPVVDVPVELIVTPAPAGAKR